ncbi:MAG: hypothetical protein L6Q57_08495, partial [Alphaproteobacteria bacterium]|nr:hypothetical protein [Alphaproteobacteria bacterium]
MNSTLRFAVTLTTSAVSAFTGVFGGLRDAQSLQPLTVSAAPQSTSVYAWQHPKPALSDPVWAVGVLRDMGRTVFTEPLPADMAVDAPVAGFPSPLRLISNPQTNKGLEVTKWYIDRTNPDNPRALSL